MKFHFHPWLVESRDGTSGFGGASNHYTSLGKGLKHPHILVSAYACGNHLIWIPRGDYLDEDTGLKKEA